MYEALARTLRVLRAERALTMAQAADGIGITRESLSYLEGGKRRISTMTLAKAAKFYDVPASMLFDLLYEDEEELEAPKAEAPTTALEQAPEGMHGPDLEQTGALERGKVPQGMQGPALTDSESAREIIANLESGNAEVVREETRPGGGKVYHVEIKPY